MLINVSMSPKGTTLALAIHGHIAAALLDTG